MALRDHLGTRCPRCKNDILQQAPTTNRMPGQADLAWCPSCKSTMTVEDLERSSRAARRGGLLARLLGKPSSS
jgi:phage FluMu protein Com